ncbi:MAG: hypothetical protein HC899_00765 [Leptolyngbyaceae cyanobacterium SM1_4_3]|nr:hypothetical protein [Leptolyngbyaceae cyanobacterium SM1_4_3]
MITGFKLSPQQRSLWSCHLDRGEYAAQSVISIQGTVDGERLRAALERVITRHDILRTRVVRSAGMMPLQVVHPEGTPLIWQPADWSDKPEQHQENQLKTTLQSERSHLHPLEPAPLVRAVWVRCSAQHHRLVLTLSSFCADTQTLNQLLTELIEHYAGQLTASSTVVQYAQYAEWQNQLRQADPPMDDEFDSEVDEDARAGQAFWQRRVVSPLSPPLRARSGEPETFEPACYRVQLDPGRSPNSITNRPNGRSLRLCSC